jgi:hypothetical protein
LAVTPGVAKMKTSLHSTSDRELDDEPDGMQ